MENLKLLGWNTYFEEQFKKYQNSGFLPARIIREDKERYILSNYDEIFAGEVTGKLLFESESNSELPKTGDWVTAQFFEDEKKAIIHKVLTRKSAFSRKAAGKQFEEQVIAANIDILFIVQSLDENFNLRRIERYLSSLLSGEIIPALIFNKTDLNSDLKFKGKMIMENFPGFTIFFTSAVSGSGINELQKFIRKGITCAFIGSSGVGKSSLINKLLGEELIQINEVRDADSKGRHTTTRRELFVIPSGGLIIDTPGMREFQLWESAGGVDSVFSEIEMLSNQCKFSNCTHTVEPGCAINEAVQAGELNLKRFESYKKLKKEEEYLRSKIDRDYFFERKEKEKRLHREIKKINKARRKF